MSTGVPNHVFRLLAESLKAWRVSGEVAHVRDGSLLLTVGDKRLSIARAAPDTLFPWIVLADERSRGAASIAGLLRVVRATIDPGYRPVRLRIAPLPLSWP